MKPLSIFARACPYGVPNTYNEVLMAGCFKGRLLVNRPMFIKHLDDDPPCGQWQQFTDLNDGLYVQGVITGREAIEQVMDGELTELSITFFNPATEAMVDRFVKTGDMSVVPTLEKELLSSRRFRALEAKEKLQKLGVNKYPGNQTVWENMPRQTVWDADISEISLVDKGAFPGTQFHIVGESQQEQQRRLTRHR